MEIISGAEAPKPFRSIDYDEIVKAYNDMAVGSVIRRERVSNITLFKQALSRRGVVEGVDFKAYNLDGYTFVERLNQNVMTRG